MKPSGRVPLVSRLAWALRERSRRALVLWCGAVLSLFCLAAASKAVVDLLRWRDAGHVARSIAGDRRAADQDRIHAIVVMQRDGETSVSLLREIEAEGGPVADHARNALLALDAARTRGR